MMIVSVFHFLVGFAVKFFHYATKRHAIMFAGLFLLTIRAVFPLAAQERYDDLPFPKAHYAVHLDKKPTKIMTTVEVAGRLYVEPLALALALDCELRTEGILAVLLTPTHVLAFAADAHCVAVQAVNSDSVSLTQMLHPVALQTGRILLPVDDVLRLLADNGVYEVDEQDATIVLKSFGNEENDAPQALETQTTIARKPLPDVVEMGLPKSNATQPSPQPAPQQPSKQFRKPTRNLYILPQDVKRREMDELPQKTSLHSPQQLEKYPKNSGTTRYAAQLLVSRLLFQAVKTKPTAEKKNSTNNEPISKKPSASSKEKQSEKKKDAQGDNDFSSAKKKWALDVIVLDAGHGGKDGGAIGVGKTKEKDVTLGIVKKLGVLLKKALPGTKIVYTRTDDTFVELDRRGQIANENGGKLFISIHCNSTPKKPTKANGFEVYILRPGRNEDAVRVAEMENAVIKLEDNPKRYKPLTDEQFIVVSMAQSAFVKYSDMAAAMISAEVKKMREIGVRGVNQAGFLVLVGASMPNMLIETGFLSNKKDEKFLKSERGQTQMASAICRAIKAFRMRYEAQINGQFSNSSSGNPATDTKVAPVTKVAPQKAASTKTVTKSSSKHTSTPSKTTSKAVSK